MEIGVWNSQGGGKDKLFCLHSLVLVNYTTQFKLCTRDYTTTVYPAGGQFLLPENLLTNPGILECILWEWVWRIFLLLNGGSDGKASACSAGDPGSIPGLGRAPGEGNGNPLQYSCLENSMDREAPQSLVG